MIAAASRANFSDWFLDWLIVIELSYWKLFINMD
jgi:hypothetical protein